MTGLVQTALIAGTVGAFMAAMTGRERTLIDNVLVGGLFTALAAYRDPRATSLATVSVAAVEGLIWGATDRLIPAFKERIMPSGM